MGQCFVNRKALHSISCEHACYSDRYRLVGGEGLGSLLFVGAPTLWPERGTEDQAPCTHRETGMR